MPFLHPAFLTALLAIGIPVAIHLSQRRKFEELAIGTLRFLKLAEKRRRLRLRVEELPLLLLRILAVALLAFLFARPFFSDLQKTEATHEQTLVLLDASGSMTPAMKAEAISVARKTAQDAGAVTFVEFSDGVRLLSSLDDYTPMAGAPSDFEKALGWSLDHLKNEGIENAKVVLIGHLAAAAMPATPPRVWPPRVQVEVHAIAPPEETNNAVRSTELLTPFATGAMEIEARLTPSTQPRVASLSAEGVNLKQNVPAGAERVLFSFRPTREEVRGTVSIEGKDAWPADDRRPFAVRWEQPEPVIILDGAPGSTPFEGQGFFLQKALAASGAAHGLSPFLPSILFGLEADRSTEDFAESGNKKKTAQAIHGVDTASAVALCGPTAITPREATTLKAAVAKGTGLFIAIDGRWTPEATQTLTDAGLFPPGVELTGGMQERRIATWDKTYPALARFSGKEAGNLRDFIWRDAFRISAGENWKVLATLEGGHPLLLEKKATDPKAGRVLVLAHPLTREWTDVPREPLFVPFVKEIFSVLTRYQARPHKAKVVTPGVHETRAIGYYQAEEGNVELVVADSVESSVTAVDSAAFKKAFALPDFNPEVVRSVAGQADANERPRTGEWWPWIVLALFLLLAIECAVATRRTSALETLTPSDS